MKNTPALSKATGVSKDQISKLDFTAARAKAETRYLTRKEQHAAILSALRRGPKTTEALRLIGAFQAPTRIFEIRSMGYSVDTTLIEAWGSDGRVHRMALYTLSEPTDTWVRPAAGATKRG